jgi:hypothetical protein
MTYSNTVIVYDIVIPYGAENKLFYFIFILKVFCSVLQESQNWGCRMRIKPVDCSQLIGPGAAKPKGNRPPALKLFGSRISQKELRSGRRSCSISLGSLTVAILLEPNDGRRYMFIETQL